MVQPRLSLALKTVATVLKRGPVHFGFALVACFVIPSVSLAQGAASVEVATVSGLPGETGTILTSVESSSSISGVSFGLCFDSTVLQNASIAACGTCTFDYFEDILTAEGLGIGVVTSFTASATLQAGIPHPVAELSYTVAPGAADFVPVTVCVLSLASPPVAIVISDPSGGEPPVTSTDGGVSLPGGAAQFIRGDFNGDGTVAVIDAIQLLTWGFLSGPAPTCLASVDFDGNANIQITLEAINVLSYLFLGTAPPSAPFPNCGSDPNLECLESGSACAQTA